MPPKFGGAAKCSVCMKSAYPNESLTFNNLLYHDVCFQCKLCGGRIGGFHLAAEKAGELYHKNCVKKLPAVSSIPSVPTSAPFSSSEPLSSLVPSPPSLVPPSFEPVEPLSSVSVASLLPLASSSSASASSASASSASASSASASSVPPSTPATTQARSRTAHLSASAPRRPPPPPPKGQVEGSVPDQDGLLTDAADEEESEEEEEEEEPAKKTIEWTCEGVIDEQRTRIEAAAAAAASTPHEEAAIVQEEASNSEATSFSAALTPEENEQVSSSSSTGEKGSAQSIENSVDDTTHSSANTVMSENLRSDEPLNVEGDSNSFQQTTPVIPEDPTQVSKDEYQREEVKAEQVQENSLRETTENIPTDTQAVAVTPTNQDVEAEQTPPPLPVSSPPRYFNHPSLTENAHQESISDQPGVRHETPNADTVTQIEQSQNITDASSYQHHGEEQQTVVTHMNDADDGRGAAIVEREKAETIVEQPTTSNNDEDNATKTIDLASGESIGSASSSISNNANESKELESSHAETLTEANSVAELDSIEANINTNDSNITDNLIADPPQDPPVHFFSQIPPFAVLHSSQSDTRETKAQDASNGSLNSAMRETTVERQVASGQNAVSLDSNTVQNEQVVDNEWEEPDVYRGRDEELPPDPEQLINLLSPLRPPSATLAERRITAEAEEMTLEMEMRDVTSALQREIDEAKAEQLASTAVINKDSAESLRERNSVSSEVPSEESETLRVLRATADVDLGTAVEALKSARKALEEARDSPFRDLSSQETTTSHPASSPTASSLVQQQLEQELTPFSPQKTVELIVSNDVKHEQQQQQQQLELTPFSPEKALEIANNNTNNVQQHQQLIEEDLAAFNTSNLPLMERPSLSDVQLERHVFQSQSLPNTPAGHYRDITPNSPLGADGSVLSPWQLLQQGRDRSQSSSYPAGVAGGGPVAWSRAQSFPGMLGDAEMFEPKVQVFNILTLSHRRERSEIVYENEAFAMEDLGSPEKVCEISDQNHVISSNSQLSSVSSNIAMVDSNHDSGRYTMVEEVLPTPEKTSLRKSDNASEGVVIHESSDNTTGDSNNVLIHAPAAPQVDINNDHNNVILHSSSSSSSSSLSAPSATNTNDDHRGPPPLVPLESPTSMHRRTTSLGDQLAYAPSPTTLVPIEPETSNGSSAVVMHAQEGDSTSERDSFPSENIGELKPGEARRLGFLKKPTVSQKKLLDYEQKINSRSNRNLALDIDGFVTKPRKVTVLKNPGTPLGMMVVTAASHTLLPGVLVADLATGGPAASTGLINRGDHLLMINGFSTVGVTVSKVMDLIRGVTSVREVILELLSPEGDVPRFLSPPKSPPSFRLPKPDLFQNAHPSIMAMYLSAENCIKFALKKALDQPMGIAISPTLPDAAVPGVFVSHVDPKGLAGADTKDHPYKLMHGDQLMMVNGQSMTGKTFAEAKAVLRECAKSREVRFEVVRTHKAVRHVLTGAPHGIVVEKGVVVSVARGSEGEKALFEPGQRILTISGLSMYPAPETLDRYLRSEPPLIIWSIQPLTLCTSSPPDNILSPVSPLVRTGHSPADAPTPPSPLAPISFLPSPIPWAIPVGSPASPPLATTAAVVSSSSVPTSPVVEARPVRLQFSEVSP